VDNAEALRIASGLLDNIAREKITLRREKTSITVSIGVANFPDSAVSEEDILLKADRAMYQAKHKGRNQVVIADNI
jgi:diguanylate cyclase (GGDEF)-like protein